MCKIQASAKIKIPYGMLDEFKQAATDYIKQVKEKDRGTLQSDWFLSSDKTECEIREIFESSEAALAHQLNLRESAAAIFGKFGSPYLVTIYGEPSREVIEIAKAGGIDVKVFSFLVGL
jgi:quinol monooxygenase YgiN